MKPLPDWAGALEIGSGGKSSGNMLKIPLKQSRLVDKTLSSHGGDVPPPPNGGSQSATVLPLNVHRGLARFAFSNTFSNSKNATLRLNLWI